MSGRRVAAGLLAALVGGAVAVPLGPSAAAAASRVQVQPWLQQQVNSAAPDTMLRVAVGGELTGATSSAAAAAAAAAASAVGMQVEAQWPLVGVAVASGTPAQVAALADQPGLAFVEGEQPLEYDLDTAHKATRADQALATYRTSGGGRVDGTGVTIAVIDSGVDATHPFFQQNGQTKVVRNLKNVCVSVTGPSDTCFQQQPGVNDTDTSAAGGHGTHVSGIAAGVEVTTTNPAGTSLRGSAPGAKLVMLSVGAGLSIINANAAFNWVIEHQKSPCKAANAQSDVPDPACPPIRVSNHSYGPAASMGGNTFNERSAAVRIQRMFVSQGGVPVWAAGNDGGDGSQANTNPDAMDPTPGVLMVASYNDAQNGSRDNQLSDFSSRGKAGTLISYPDVSAPGDLITSSCRPQLPICRGTPSYDGGNYQTISGTSMAAPYTAGIVATLFGANPALTPAQVEDVLEDTAHQFTAGAAYETDPGNSDATGTSYDKGHGLLDVLAAQASVLGLSAPGEPAPVPAAVACGGTNLVKDPAGDQTTPVAGTTAGAAQDLTALSFAADATTIAVTATIANYSAAPSPGTSDTYYLVSWTAPNGKTYAVRHIEPAGGYELGEYTGGAGFVAGTSMTITGSTMMGAGGGVTWQVPRDKVGNPTIPIDPTVDRDAVPAVVQPRGVVIGGIGSAATGGVTFTAPIDQAPSSGSGPSWSVCASGGTANSGGTTQPDAVVPEVPLAALLPLVALVLLGSSVWVGRRRGALR